MKLWKWVVGLLGVGGLLSLGKTSRASDVGLTVASRAYGELEKWRGLTETNPDARPLLTRYWAAAGLPLQPTTTPWSAAFVSDVLNFRPGMIIPSPAHVDYVHAGYRARKLGKRDTYWALTPEEAGPLRPGDVVVKARPSDSGPDARGWTLADLVDFGGFVPTHGDVVFEPSPGGGAPATGVGGNLSNSVRQTPIPTDAFGRASGAIAVMRHGAAVRTLAGSKASNGARGTA